MDMKNKLNEYMALEREITEYFLNLTNCHCPKHLNKPLFDTLEQKIEYFEKTHFKIRASLYTDYEDTPLDELRAINNTITFRLATLRFFLFKD